MIPANTPIVARRNALYAEEFAFTGEDAVPISLAGYTASMQVRRRAGDLGDPLIVLGPVTADQQGIRFVDRAAGAIEIRIEISSLREVYGRFAHGLRPGSALALAYDLVMIPEAGADEVWLEGDFIIPPGVTVPVGA